MHRLYVQIYLTVIASLLLVVLGAGMLWRVAAESVPWAQGLRMAGEVATAVLPPADAPREVQQQALQRLSQGLRADLALYDERLALVASAMRTSGAVPGPGRPRTETGARGGWGWHGGVHDDAHDGENDWDEHDGGRGWRLNLPDGRRLAVRLSGEHRWPRAAWWGWPAWVGVLLLIALAVGIAAHPVVRRITRRLERLEQGVNAFGLGDLTARVRIHGHGRDDEVARLAKSFNRAAERIEALVKSHRNLLANASHELRTPLARIRMGVELLKGRPSSEKATQREAELAAALVADLAELDAMIEEILTASRLDAGSGTEAREEVDFLALAAEECARYDQCKLEGDPAQVQGEPRLLRRMIRNLLENAKRHGAPPIDVTVRNVSRALQGGDGGRDGGKGGGMQRAVALCVRDHGPGVPESEREKIFDAFYRLPGATATGTGLGLALVRQIARRHGGDARLAPAAGGGTCIEVVIAAGGR